MDRGDDCCVTIRPQTTSEQSCVDCIFPTACRLERCCHAAAGFLNISCMVTYPNFRVSVVGEMLQDGFRDAVRRGALSVLSRERKH